MLLIKISLTFVLETRFTIQTKSNMLDVAKQALNFFFEIV